MRKKGREVELGELEKRLGYRFMRPGLLEQALTHPSNQSGNMDNQRLEFLGDSLLGFLLANQLYHLYPESDEGRLTILRSQCASGAALARIAREMGLGEFLLLGSGADQDGQRERESNLAAALEAILGAAWIDGGLEAIVSVYNALFDGRVRALELEARDENPKGRLQELLQAKGLELPKYLLVETQGSEHAPLFIVEVEAEGGKARGSGGSKRLAESAAATAWLQRFSG